jgi:predicted acylesterase/phospholipase RssA
MAKSACLTEMLREDEVRRKQICLFGARNGIDAFVNSFVCAAPASNTRFVRRFRTYEVLKHTSANCAIWEAARATTAAPRFFKEIHIAGPGGIEERFIDGGIGCNNPVKEVMHEARLLFGDDRRIATLVSIGTGEPGPIGLATPDIFQRLLPTALIRLLADTASNCQSTADDIQRLFANLPDIYFRYNVPNGAGMVSLEEWKKISDIVTHTKSYVQDETVFNSLDLVAKRLCGHSSPRDLTLANICQLTTFGNSATP